MGVPVRHSHGFEVDGVLHFFSHGHGVEYWNHDHRLEWTGEVRAKRPDYEKWVKAMGGIVAPTHKGK